MTYGYARVSTASQALSGSSLEDQVLQLCEAGVPMENIYRENYTGTTVDRPQFRIIIDHLQSGDRLVVTKLDRIARTAVEGGTIVKQLIKKGVTIHILNMGIADDTAMGKLMVNMLLAFAEFERDMIVERTQEGRKRTGRTGGRPKLYSQPKRDLAMKLLDEGQSYHMVEEQTGISKSTLIRERRKNIHPLK